MSQLKIDKFVLFLGIIIIVAVLAASVSLYDLYQSTNELNDFMEEHTVARKAERAERAEVDRLLWETNNTFTVETVHNDLNTIVVLIRKNETAYYSEMEVKRIIHSTAVNYSTGQLEEFTDDLFERLKFLVDKRENIVVFQKYLTIMMKGKADE